MRFGRLIERQAKRMPEGLIVDYGNYDYIILQSFVCVVYENHVSSCCFCSDEELPSEKTT
jgi:hypothetical protein